MKKYNNYKKYYESHKEQEKKRTSDYYWTNREEILAKKKAKRDAMPKEVKLTAYDYVALWKEMYMIAEWKDTYIALLMKRYETERLDRKKEMLKDD